MAIYIPTADPPLLRRRRFKVRDIETEQKFSQPRCGYCFGSLGSTVIVEFRQHYPGSALRNRRHYCCEQCADNDEGGLFEPLAARKGRR